MTYTAEGEDVSRVDAILEMLQQTLVINPRLLTSSLLVMDLSFRNVTAIPDIAIAAIAGFACAAAVQGVGSRESLSCH